MNVKGVIVILLVGSLMAGSYPVYRIYRKKQGDNIKVNDLIYYGNVDIRRVALAFRTEGRLLALHFEEGDRVSTGALVAVLDKEPLEEELAHVTTEVAAAKANLERMKNGYRPQEIKVARALVEEREASLKALQPQYERHRALEAEGAITKQSFDDTRALRDVALARLFSASEELALRKEGYRREDIEEAQAQLASAEARLEIARTNLKDASLYSPANGTVLTRVLEPGSIVHMGDPVITVSLSDPVWVRAYVPESDLGRVFPGMKAEIVSDTSPDHPYVGHVGYISPEAEFTPKNVETPSLRTRLVYSFRVIAENPDEGLRQGMPVTVKLHSDNINIASSSRYEEKK